MTWSVAILDDGITNALQARLGKPAAYEWDYYFGTADTDEGIADTHGDRVALSALAVSSAFDLDDLKVASAANGEYPYDRIEQALDYLLASGGSEIGAVNMSFRGTVFPSQFADEIGELAGRGVLTVAAAGNGGTRQALESPSYPAALANVIAVGSHDGSGRPSPFSQGGPGVDLLADGEDMPGPGLNGTSFAAPRVAATVTHVQAIVEGLTGTRLSVGQMIDALQLGGAGPRSSPDPADGTTRYFLHDHAGSLDYAWSRYGGTPTLALEYVASHPDLIAALGASHRAGRLHFENHGSIEERGISFDGLDYVASYDDLVGTFGADARAGAGHYIGYGSGEGRAVLFDGLQYIASYGDLIAAFGPDREAGSPHYIAWGAAEGRQRDEFDAPQYLANYADLQAAFGADEQAAATHFITFGYAEGRTDDPLPATAAATDFMI
ncbi:MAG TPA: S8 family serine peptidase [Geminicoccaceae bacterium]|nr:S8 family serine peptidase [Geminicoccaceae bacterium]